MHFPTNFALTKQLFEYLYLAVIRKKKRYRYHLGCDLQVMCLYNIHDGQYLLLA